MLKSKLTHGTVILLRLVCKFVRAEAVEDELTKSYHFLCLVSESVKEAPFPHRNSQREDTTLREREQTQKRCRNSYFLLQWRLTPIFAFSLRLQYLSPAVLE